MIALAWIAGAVAYCLVMGAVAVAIGRSIRLADDRLAATLEPARNAPAGTWAA